MRTGIVIIGAALMVVGFLLLSVTAVFFSGEASGFFDFSSLFNPRASSSASSVFFLPQIAGLGIAAVGFIVFIAGLAASPSEKHHAVTVQPPTQNPTVLAICPNCKARVPAEAKFCNECGADLKPKT